MSIQEYMGKWLYAMVDSGERIYFWHASGVECPVCGSTDTYDSLGFIDVDGREISLLMCASCESITSVFVDGVLYEEADDDAS